MISRRRRSTTALTSGVLALRRRRLIRGRHLRRRRRRGGDGRCKWVSSPIWVADPTTTTAPPSAPPCRNKPVLLHLHIGPSPPSAAACRRRSIGWFYFAIKLLRRSKRPINHILIHHSFRARYAQKVRSSRPTPSRAAPKRSDAAVGTDASSEASRPQRDQAGALGAAYCDP